MGNNLMMKKRLLFLVVAVASLLIIAGCTQSSDAQSCKTVADYRVEDCVGLGEYPQGSNIERSVLAAAWQFRVRPPRINGVSQVGDWVRIRITYTIDLQGPAAGPAKY